jgi:hypothetical protein
LLCRHIVGRDRLEFGWHKFAQKSFFVHHDTMVGRIGSGPATPRNKKLSRAAPCPISIAHSGVEADRFLIKKCTRITQRRNNDLLIMIDFPCVVPDESVGSDASHREELRMSGRTLEQRRCNVGTPNSWRQSSEVPGIVMHYNSQVRKSKAKRTRCLCAPLHDCLRRMQTHPIA